MFSPWKAGAKHMNLFLLCQRLRLSKLFIVPGLALLGEAGYGRYDPGSFANRAGPLATNAVP